MTRLPRESKPLRHPAGLREFPVDARATDRASRVASAPLRAHAGATTPAEATGFVPFATLFGGVSGLWQPSPECRRVGLRIKLFEVCSTFTRVPACALAEPPSGGPFPSECFRPPRSLWQPLRVLPAGTNSCRAGFAPAEAQCLSTAHENQDPYEQRRKTPQTTKHGLAPVACRTARRMKDARLLCLGRRARHSKWQVQAKPIRERALQRSLLASNWSQHTKKP